MPHEDRERRFLNRLGTRTGVTTMGSLSVAWLDGNAEQNRLERFGVEHLVREHRRLATPSVGLVSDPRFSGWSPPGPHFDYSTSSALFGNRRGTGPLLVALDTNQVLDYYEHGGNMWTGQRHDDVTDPEYLGDIDCFSLLLALSVVRDLRFFVVPETLRDAKKKVSAGRLRVRRVAFEQFSAAMEHVTDADEDFEIAKRQMLSLPDPIVDEAIDHVPGALDRMMVRAAFRRGSHVFMTRDKQVLAARAWLAPLGLLIASPGDIFEHLLGAGAFNCMIAPRWLSWPLPDQHRVGHLIQAIADYQL